MECFKLFTLFFFFCCCWGAVFLSYSDMSVCVCGAYQNVIYSFCVFCIVNWIVFFCVTILLFFFYMLCIQFCVVAFRCGSHNSLKSKWTLYKNFPGCFWYFYGIWTHYIHTMVVQTKHKLNVFIGHVTLICIYIYCYLRQ